MKLVQSAPLPFFNADTCNILGTLFSTAFRVALIKVPPDSLSTSMTELCVPLFRMLRSAAQTTEFHMQLKAQYLSLASTLN